MTEIQRESLFFSHKISPWRWFWRKTIEICIKLQTQTIWELEVDNWRICLRGEAPQTYFSNTNLKNSNTLILQFYPNFDFFFKICFKVKSWKKAFLVKFQSFGFVKTWFAGSYPNFLHFVQFQQNQKNQHFVSIRPNFNSKLYYFFKWPEISKY